VQGLVRHEFGALRSLSLRRSRLLLDVQGDLPHGQITENLSSPVSKNFLLSSEAKSVAYRARPVPKEGRIAIVTERWSGTRWRRRAH
jgi:hypothetical protein